MGLFSIFLVGADAVADGAVNIARALGNLRLSRAMEPANAGPLTWVSNSVL